jgi:hypothetical protein
MDGHAGGSEGHLNGELGLGTLGRWRHLPEIFERGAEVGEGRERRRSVERMETGRKPMIHCRL